MKNQIKVVAAILILIGSISSYAKDDVISIATHRIVPYTGNDKGNVGFLTEVVNAAFSASNVKVNFENYPWARGRLYVLNGKVDGIFPISFGEAKELNVDKVLIYKTPPLIFLKKKEKKIQWSGHLDSLIKYNIGALRAVSYTEEFDRNLSLKKDYVNINEQIVKMVLYDRIDVGLLDKLSAEYFLSKPLYRNVIEILTPPLINSSELYLGFSRSNGNRKKYELAFRNGLETIKKNGTFTAILKKFQVDSDIRLHAIEKVEITKFKGKSTKYNPVGSGVLSKIKKSDPKNMIIGFCGFHWETDGYQQTYKRELTKEAKRLGLKLINYDAKASIETQIEQVEMLIKKDVDLIAIWPVHGKKILPVLEKAKRAKIPVLIVNTPIDNSGFHLIRGYAGPNNFHEGRLAAQMMIQALNGKGKIVEIQGFPGYSTALERSIGFSEELEKQMKNNPKVKIELVDIISGYWSREKAKQAAERLLRRHEHFDGIYVGDDNMGVGALEALEKSNRQKGVKITSATLFKEGYDAIKRGKIYGSVWQSPIKDAKLALKVAVKIVKREKIKFFNFFDTPKVTKKNIKKFKRPTF